MQKLKIIIFSLILITSLFFSSVPAQAQEPVVHAVLFYSPTCGHCEMIITQVIPPLIEQYGSQLQIIGIDVSQEGGSAFYQAAIQRFSIPENRLGVPTLIIEETVLLGSQEIPEQLPILIADSLKNGGNDWPDIPGLREALIAEGAIQEDNATQTPQAATSAPAEPGQPLFVSAFMKDPVANGISVGLLVVMILVVIAVIILFIREEESKLLNGPRWIIPALALIGMFIAGYMTYVEVTRADAICGPIGDCNTVQDSIYARIFGFLPVGIMGMIGYVLIFGAWLFQTYGPEKFRDLSTQAIWGMSWFGMLFSIYLTFLEPFVIGASCAWCLSSATVMTLIFWFSTGPAKATWKSETLEDESNEEAIADYPEIE